MMYLEAPAIFFWGEALHVFYFLARVVVNYAICLEDKSQKRRDGGGMTSTAHAESVG